MREITVVGYGNQGKAWAKNLKDSAWNVKVFARSGGKGERTAREEGFLVVSYAQLLETTGPIAILLPDEQIARFLEPFRGSSQEPRQFVFAHGYALTYGNIKSASQDDFVLVAPKGIGQKLRENYLTGSGVLGVLAVSQDATGTAWDLAENLAKGLGLDRVGIIKTTVEKETFADLLSEQVVLCGAVPRLVEEGERFLVEKGIPKEIARYECLNELKLIVDMMVEHGVEGMFQKISTAARFGGQKAADIVLPMDGLRSSMNQLWQNIESGEFARRLEAELKREKP